MSQPRIFLAADHGGASLMARIATTKAFATAFVVTPHPHDGDDYPRAIADLARQMTRPTDRAIVICRSGVGMALAANRYRHLRAVHAHDPRIVARARAEEDANVLSLGGEYVTFAAAQKLVKIFLRTPFRRTIRDRRRLALIDRYARPRRR